VTAAAIPATQDRSRLRRDLARAGRRRRLLAIGLIAPLFLFLLFSFIIPIGDMLRRAVVDSEIAETWPHAAAMLRQWDRRKDPDEAMFAVLGRDIEASAKAHTVATAARRLNYAIDGGRSLVMDTGRALRKLDAEPPSWREALVAANPAWGDKKTWIASLNFKPIDSKHDAVLEQFLETLKHRAPGHPSTLS